MKVNIFSARHQQDPNTSKSSKKQIFSSVRFRILAWYFLLTTCTVLVSVVVTRQIFCTLLESQTKEALEADISRFDRLIKQQALKDESAQLKTIVEEALPLYVLTRDKYILTVIEGQIFNDRSLPLPEAIANNSTLLEEWNQVSSTIEGELVADDGPFYYVAKPIEINDVEGVVVAVRDARADYQTGTGTVILVVQVATVVLTVFFAIAWITAGQVLFPLRRVTQTARRISQTDMSQRITAKGTDEIAELSATFNAMLDRIQSAFESQQEFLKDAGHELRTPITVIQGHLEILKYRPEKQEKTIALVTDELTRMSRLVNDLLLIAKAEQPHFLQIKSEELDWFTEELYLKSRALAKRDWRLESKGLSPVAIDKGRLTQAVMNLVQNAVRHTQENDTIALGSTVRGEYVYLWVRDTGEGIAPEDRERIFDRFARASEGDRCLDARSLAPNGERRVAPASRRDFASGRSCGSHRYSAEEGAGLGLSIVEAIATAHNGWVELDSKLKIGSTFTIVFPLSQEVINEPNSDCRRQPPHRRIHRSRVTGTRIHDSYR